MRELSPKWVGDLPYLQSSGMNNLSSEERSPQDFLHLDLMYLEPRLVIEKRRKASRRLWKVGWRIMLEKLSRASIFLCI